MSTLYERFMLTANSDGKLTRAVLQRQVDEPVLFHDAVNYEDVRELPVSPDGKEAETDLEDEWEAVIETMDHKDFVDFMAWVWSDKE